MLLVDKDKNPISNLITWEDRRCLSIIEDSTYIDKIRAVQRKRENRNGCVLSSGYMGATLYWFCKNGLLPDETYKAVSIGDYIFGILTGGEIFTDSTYAASSGVFDIVNGWWDEELISNLGIPADIFPEISEPGEIKGYLQKTVSEKTGLPSGIPVSCAIGDNQASVLGSLNNWGDVVVNIGTGSQISFLTDEYSYTGGLEVRPFFDGKYLYTGAGLCAGRAYSLLNDFILDIGKTFFGIDNAGDVFEIMNKSAEMTGADGLVCDTRFEGTRGNSDIKGAFLNVNKKNFTIAHFCRAVLEGIVNELYEYYMKNKPAIEEECSIIASGNAVRKNPVMGMIIALIFGMPVKIPLYEEEAAYGAGLFAGINAGIIKDYQHLMSLIQYGKAVYV
ncbi:hypothetical protein KAS50_06565, partial [bacterium]|nr:hypothetical protein [bacterium]